ncbi:MAG: hypothetical protein HQL49_03690 [Gammaproteobacteria bacterium]|nr:hypothetical protein [Gammaproteobacteria bacterium]
MREEQTPIFIDQMIAKVSAAVAADTPENSYLNTWGDAIFAVMESATQLAQFALSLKDAVSTYQQMTDQETRIGIRIALHAGPVFHMRDHFTGKMNYYGHHVNRTARLEPVTEGGRDAGQRYAT